MLAGKGLSIEEYTKIGIAFERIRNSNIFRKGRKIYRIIHDKDEQFIPILYILVIKKI